MNDQTPDRELLCRYAEQRDETAFAELVRRQVNFVYGCAMRRVNGDAHLAEDVTQQVFSDLARRAGELARHEALGGWLYTSTRFAAAHVVRTEQRRRLREQTALTMNAAADQPTPPDQGEKLRPVLDQTIDELDERDRVAVVMRFFEGRSFAEIGAQLRLTENGARMRVERALDKLHALLARRGIRSSAAVLGVTLAGEAAIVAPAGLASAVTAAAVGGGAAAAVATGAWGWASFMSMSKLQVVLTGSLAAAGAVGFAVQADTTAALRAEAAALRRDNAAIQALEVENLRLGRLAVEVGELRRDDAELSRLEEEAAGLRTRLQQIARVEETRAAARVYELSMLDQTPRARFQARPSYPFEMRRAGITGEVVVEFIVDSNGDVQKARAVRSSQKEFEAAAVQAVSKWRFLAGRKGGRDVATRMQVPIVFSLEGKPTQGAAVPKAATTGAAAEAVTLQPFVTQATSP